MRTKLIRLTLGVICVLLNTIGIILQIGFGVDLYHSDEPFFIIWSIALLVIVLILFLPFSFAFGYNAMILNDDKE